MSCLLLVAWLLLTCTNVRALDTCQDGNDSLHEVQTAQRRLHDAWGIATTFGGGHSQMVGRGTHSRDSSVPWTGTRISHNSNSYHNILDGPVYVSSETINEFKGTGYGTDQQTGKATSSCATPAAKPRSSESEELNPLGREATRGTHKDCAVMGFELSMQFIMNGGPETMNDFNAPCGNVQDTGPTTIGYDNYTPGDISSDYHDGYSYTFERSSAGPTTNHEPCGKA